MCNDMGVSHDPMFAPYLAVKSAYASASTMARKKTANPELKRQYEKITKLNESIKALAATKTEMMGETGVYREIRKRHTAVQRKLWCARRQLWREKKMLVHMCPRPVAVIIPRRVSVVVTMPVATISAPLSTVSPDSDGDESTNDGDAQESHHLTG